MKGLIFTYALTYGGSVVALFRPFYGLLIYICFSIICPENLWFWSVSPGHYSRIIALALLIGWVFSGCGTWNFGRGRGIVLSLVGFFIVLNLEVALVSNGTKYMTAIEAISKILLTFVVGLTMIDSVAKLKQLIWVIVLSQGYLAYEFNQMYYAGAFADTDFSFRSLDNNGIAIVMVTTLGLALFQGMESPRWAGKALGLAAAGFMAHVVLFSMSRGGMLALVVLGAVSFVLIAKQPRHYVLLLAMVLVVVRLTGPSVQREFMSSFADEAERDGSASLRIRHWKACVESMFQHPLGVGPDMWSMTAPEFGLPAMEAHSTWLQLGAEMGVPGLLTIGGFYGLCIGRLWPIARNRIHVSDPWLQSLARMIIASLMGFIVSSQFVTSDMIELPYFIVLIGAGALKVTAQQVPVPSDPQPWRVPLASVPIPSPHDFA